MARKFNAERLVALRGNRTQHDLASALRRRGFGTTQTTVSRWESGQTPRSSVVGALADELGVKPDELFDADDEEAASMSSLQDASEMVAVLMPRSALTGGETTVSFVVRGVV